MKKRRFLAMLISLGMIAGLLAGCGGGNADKPDDKGGEVVTEDGKDADGNVVDLTKYAVSLGKQWFTEEDEEIWAHITDKSSNPDKIVWRHSTTGRSCDESPMARGDKRFFIEMKKLLGDRIEFQMFFNGALGGSPDQVLGGLQAKSFESASYNVGAFYEYTRAFTPLDVGYLIPDLEAGIEVCKFGSPARDLMVNRCIDDAGLRVLTLGAIGMRHITNNKHPINTMADLNGLKIRVQNNNMHMAMFENFGCSPTPIPFSELFTALQQKTVDGQENPISNIYDMNYAEVQKYLTITNHLYTAGALVTNNDWITSLPADVQDAIQKASEASQEQSGKDLLNCEAKMLEYLSTKMEVNELSEDAAAEFKKAAQVSWDMAGDVMGADYWDSVRTAIENTINAM